MNYAIILCGGEGSRLWPLSTKHMPKQFHKITNCSDNDDILINNTINRLPSSYKKVFVSNISYKHLIDQYRDSEFIYEYHPKSTGPIILLACLHIYNINKHIDPNNINIIILPCDHVFDIRIFNQKIQEGLDIIDDHIITFGITPTYPDTSYGYIKKDSSNNIHQFIEKPPLNIATQFVQNGSYYWNSGIFLSKLSTLMSEYIYHNKYIYDNISDCYNKSSYSNNILYIHDDYKYISNISFDYLIMEHTKKGKIITYDGLWSDVGELKKIYNISNKDNNNNVIIGNNCNIFDSTGCYVNCDEKNNVIVNNVDNIIVVLKNNTLFISNINNLSNINSIKQHITFTNNI